MPGKSRGPGPPHRTSHLFHLAFLLYLLSFVTGEKNKMYTMDTLCRETSTPPIYRKVDGALIKSQNEKQLECTLTFQTHSILQRFLLRFDMLSLDCNDHLFIYDGSHAVGEYKHDLSCANTKTTVGAITTRTNFVTLKYVTDSWGTDSNGFELVITAVKDSAHQCKDFNCQLSPFCISPDLVCDAVSHCNDASDEDPAMCSKYDPSIILGLNSTTLVFVSILVVVLLAVCALCAHFYRTVPLRWNHETTRIDAQQMYAGANGTSKGGTGVIAPATPVIGHTVLGPKTENWAHPAALGYPVVSDRLYFRAE